MTNKLRSIVRIDEPKVKRGRKSPHDIFSIWYEGTNDPAFLSRTSFNIEMLCRKLIGQGASQEDLDEFKSLVYREGYNDGYEDS